MELNYFKDILFDLLNESDALDVTDILCDDAAGIFHVRTGDGSVFMVCCSQTESPRRIFIVE